MFEQAFRNIDDVLRKEAGCTTELDYTEQTSWLEVPGRSRTRPRHGEFRELTSETQHLESLYTRKLAALDELKQALLQQAFSGAL